jgi:hypothetical protein
MKLFAMLALCTALHADVTFSTGSAEAVLVAGYGPADWMDSAPVSGVAQDGQTLAPWLAFHADCYRTDAACLYNTGVATITVPISLTDGLGETVTQTISYTASDWVSQEGYHYVTGQVGPAATFSFSDGEQWTVTETQALNGRFHDWDQVYFGSLSFADPVQVPEPNAFFLAAALLIWAMGALTKQRQHWMR